MKHRGGKSISFISSGIYQDEVIQAIESIASISEENSAAIEEVSASAQEMSSQVQEVTNSAQSLAEMASTLRQVISHFNLEAATTDINKPALAPSTSAKIKPDPQVTSTDRKANRKAMDDYKEKVTT
ncbi:MAG: hypothetical protein JW908_13275 [Anaerolineales bacterium]|nr:hypothetical protein [Anaerolineales bacterium]